MISNPIIVSIPHTGTRFLKERLGIDTFIHTNQRWEKIVEEIGDRPLIAPLRKPTNVWRSWERRRNPKGENFPYVEFAGAWHMMHTLDVVYGVDFIDLEKRDDPRITDWSKVGDEDYGDFRHEMTDLRNIHQLPFVVRAYGKWVVK